jgi:hypothetical protein
MPPEGGSFTNHPGVVDFGGKSLFFYHNGALPGGGGYKRSVSVEEFTYDADGKIPQLHMTDEGAAAVASLNPFAQVEAETMARSSGVETEVCSEGGMKLTQLDNGDYIELKEVEFGKGATALDLRVAAATPGTVELRLDALDGTVIGTCTVEPTGGAQTWMTQACDINNAEGKHNLFLRFTSGGFEFNWWKFTGPGESSTETNGETSDVSTVDETGSSATNASEDSATAPQPTTTGSSGTSSITGSNATAPLSTSNPPISSSSTAAITTASPAATTTDSTLVSAPPGSSENSSTVMTGASGAQAGNTGSGCEIEGKGKPSNNASAIFALGAIGLAAVRRRTGRSRT